MSEMSMTMVERVAERLLNVHRRRNGWPAAKLSDMAPEHRAEWLEDARAAIEAMREPTDDMVDFGVGDFPLCSPECGYYGPDEYHPAARAIFIAMIDGALSGEGE